MGVQRPLGLLWKKLLILKVLYEKGTHYSKTAVSRSCGVGPHHIAASIVHLVENGFILEENWKPNGRGKKRDNLIYKITPEGKEVLVRWAALMEALKIE